MGKSSALEQLPPLGMTLDAEVYKPFLATVASDPTQGAIAVLRKLQTDLNNARGRQESHGLLKAMDNYQNTDHTNATTSV